MATGRRVTAAARCGAALAALLLAACAQVPDDPDARAEFESQNDPLEPMNRAFFSFNMTLDDYVLRPVAKTYRDQLPQSVKRGTHNALNNLKSPYIFANDLLQGEPHRAADTLGRFMVNSTFGVLGVFDVTADKGPKFHDEDVGQTLAVWGVDEGPYLMLPFFGPSNPRDATGKAVEWVADPTDLALGAYSLWLPWSRFGVDTVDSRARLIDPIDDLKRNSLDFYAAVRSLYRQSRQNAIANKDGSGSTGGMP